MAEKVGRPSKYPKIDLAQVESLGGLGLINEEIRLFLEISNGTFYNYLKKHPEFMEAVKKGKLKYDIKAVQRLHKRGVEDGDVTALIFWLKNRQPDRWRDKHDVDISAEIKLLDFDFGENGNEK